MIKIYLWILLALLVIAQILRPTRSNPPERPDRAWATHVRVTPQVESILKRACYDCHSHQTRWPWYSEIAPLSWSVVEHVREGRKKLNFSEIPGRNETDSIKRIEHKLEEIEEEVAEGEMPLWEYTLLHPEARISESDITAIREWVTVERRRMAGLLAAHDSALFVVPSASTERKAEPESD